MADVRATADRVLEAAADLGKLRKRLAELDAERADLEKKIRDRLAQMGMGESADPGGKGSAADRILAFMRRNPNVVYSASDFAREWRMTRHSDVNNLRTALNRLHTRGKIERLSVGRYVFRAKTPR